jgi:death-on-curing protein
MTAQSEPVWVLGQAIKVLHERSLARHGSIRRRLESALENRFHYDVSSRDLCSLKVTVSRTASIKQFVDGDRRRASPSAAAAA